MSERQVGGVGGFLWWNDALGEHFFNQAKAGRTVTFAVSTAVLSQLGSHAAIATPQFLAAVLAGPPWVRPAGICQQALQSAHEWRSRGLSFPPYLAYLAAFVVAAGAEGDFAAHAYYPRLRAFLGLEGSGPVASFDRMLDLWGDLETWTSRDKTGALGIFQARIFGRRIHVGLPIAQSVLSEGERASMPRLFALAELDPTLPIPNEELARAARESGKDLLLPRTLDLLGGRGDHEMRDVLLDTLADLLAQWDGASMGDATGPLAVRGSLRLSATLDSVAGDAKVGLRCKLNRSMPDKVNLVRAGSDLRLSCVEDAPGWSTFLSDSNGHLFDASSANWLNPFQLREEILGWTFRLRGSASRILVSGDAEGLPGLIEAGSVPFDRDFHLVAHDSVFAELKRWLERSCTGVHSLSVRGLPRGWTWTAVSRARPDDEASKSFPSLFPRAGPSIAFRGGIRASVGNTFFAFAPPQVEIADLWPGDRVTLNGKQLMPAQNGRYRIPESSAQDVRLTVAVSRDGEDAATLGLYLHPGNVSRHEGRPPFSRPLSIADQADAGGTAVSGAWLEPAPGEIERISFPPLAVPRKERSSGILLLGAVPGEVADWPDEGIPLTWAPVWAVTQAKAPRAYLCGEARPPVSSTMTSDRRRLELWTDVLWHRRKRIRAPRQPGLRRLWLAYVRFARDASG